MRKQQYMNIVRAYSVLQHSCCAEWCTAMSTQIGSVCCQCMEDMVGRAILQYANMCTQRLVSFHTKHRECVVCGTNIRGDNIFTAEIDVPLLYMHFSTCTLTAYILMRAHGARVDLAKTIRQIVDSTVSQYHHLNM